jgi:hypothetical protein
MQRAQKYTLALLLGVSVCVRMVACQQCGPGNYTNSTPGAPQPCLPCPAGTFGPFADVCLWSGGTAANDMRPTCSTIYDNSRCYPNTVFQGINMAVAYFNYYRKEVLEYVGVDLDQPLLIANFTTTPKPGVSVPMSQITYKIRYSTDLSTWTILPSAYTTPATVGQSITYPLFVVARSVRLVPIKDGYLDKAVMFGITLFGSTRCLPGTYSSALGASAASDCIGRCPRGSYSTAYGLSAASNCNLCAPGTFSDQLGATAASPCPPGTYSSAIGATSNCSGRCPPGTYSTAYALKVESDCSSCMAGTYSSVLGASVCADCLATTYSSSVGASSPLACGTCDWGYFASPSGRATGCLQCPAGKWYYPDPTYFTPGICHDCSYGTYLPTVGTDPWSCLYCPGGKYTGVFIYGPPQPIIAYHAQLANTMQIIRG